MGDYEEKKTEAADLCRKLRFAEAIGVLKEMAESSPSDPFVLYHLACCLSQEHQIHEAYALFQRLLKVEGNEEQQRIARQFIQEYKEVEQDNTRDFLTPKIKKAGNSLTCKTHQEEASYLCHECGAPLCFRCTYPHNQRMLCFTCYQKKKRHLSKAPSQETKEASSQESDLSKKTLPILITVSLLLLFFAYCSSRFLKNRATSFSPLEGNLEYRLGTELIKEDQVKTLPPHSLSQMHTYITLSSFPKAKSLVIFKVFIAYPNGAKHTYLFPQRIHEKAENIVLPIFFEQLPIKAFSVQAMSL